MENRTGLFTNMIIWFGVAISVSEIEAGIGIGNASTLTSSILTGRQILKIYYCHLVPFSCQIIYTY